MRQRGFTLWLTGLSGAGKSTLAGAVAAASAARVLRCLEELGYLQSPTHG